MWGCLSLGCSLRRPCSRLPGEGQGGPREDKAPSSARDRGVGMEAPSGCRVAQSLRGWVPRPPPCFTPASLPAAFPRRPKPWPTFCPTQASESAAGASAVSLLAAGSLYLVGFWAQLLWGSPLWAPAPLVWLSGPPSVSHVCSALRQPDLGRQERSFHHQSPAPGKGNFLTQVCRCMDERCTPWNMGSGPPEATVSTSHDCCTGPQRPREREKGMGRESKG